jgi:hypothetical protein
LTHDANMKKIKERLSEDIDVFSHSIKLNTSNKILLLLPLLDWKVVDIILTT